LNRSLQLSDEALVDRMQTRSAVNGYRVSSLIESIVSSSQFRNKRVPEKEQVPGLASKPGKTQTTKAKTGRNSA